MEETAAWVATNPLDFDPELAMLARRALDRLVDPDRCELALLWVRETLGPPDRHWLDATEQIANRLDALLDRESLPIPVIPLTRVQIR